MFRTAGIAEGWNAGSLQEKEETAASSEVHWLQTEATLSPQFCRQQP